MTVVAIDGPAGAGKSSVARAVASALGFRYVDTGAMYRTIALEVLDHGVAASDQAAVEELARSVATDLDVEPANRDRSARLRDPEVGTVASVIARYPGVRRALSARQRQVVIESDVVMEGRDIGTVIAPDAEVKLYLTASRPVRAKRRQQQLTLPDDQATLERVEQAMAERDHADSVRVDSPLRPASDAVQIDSTDRDLTAVVKEVLEIVNHRLGPR